MEKEEDLKTTLSDQETSRLAFVVYRKALIYMGGVIAFVVAVLGFWGYDDWKDLRKSIEVLGKKATKADSIIAANIENFTRLNEDREEFRVTYLRQSVQLEQLEKTLNQKVEETLSVSDQKVKSFIDSANAHFSREQKKLSHLEERLDAQIVTLEALRKDVQKYLDSLRTAGSTVLLLQANKSNSFKQEFNFTIMLGNVKNEYVEDVEIRFEHSKEGVRIDSIPMGEEYQFRCKACGKQMQLMDMQYFLIPITRLAQPIVHDLLVARLRWQAIPQ